MVRIEFTGFFPHFSSDFIRWLFQHVPNSDIIISYFTCKIFFTLKRPNRREAGDGQRKWGAEPRINLGRCKNESLNELHMTRCVIISHNNLCWIRTLGLGRPRRHQHNELSFCGRLSQVWERCWPQTWVGPYIAHHLHIHRKMHPQIDDKAFGFTAQHGTVWHYYNILCFSVIFAFDRSLWARAFVYLLCMCVCVVLCFMPSTVWLRCFVLICET